MGYTGATVPGFRVGKQNNSQTRLCRARFNPLEAVGLRPAREKVCRRIRHVLQLVTGDMNFGLVKSAASRPATYASPARVSGLCRDRARRRHADEIVPLRLALGQALPRLKRVARCDEGAFRHFPKIPCKVERERAVIHGSLLREAWRISSGHPRSFSVTGVPKQSTMALEAAMPTDCSSDRRMR